MSVQLIKDYLAELDVLKKISGSKRETTVREAFEDLLKAWGKQHRLVFIAECPIKTAMKTNIAADGALLPELRMPLGYWEAKDEGDDLDAEIAIKFRKGYPQDNIVFTDDATAVLLQNRNDVMAQIGKSSERGPITKDAIFHYDYAVLQDPVYREKYAINLKREFPRIPMYGGGEAGDAAFWQWADRGAALLDLHLNYETVAPLQLARTDTPDAKARAAGVPPKVVLKSDPDGGRIVIDSETVLAGIPRSAWN